VSRSLPPADNRRSYTERLTFPCERRPSRTVTVIQQGSQVVLD
jgi:hypothetical protein